jgi:hypothetical protein
MSSFQASKHNHKHKLLSWKITKIRHNKYPYNKLELLTRVWKAAAANWFYRQEIFWLLQRCFLSHTMLGKHEVRSEWIPGHSMPTRELLLRTSKFLFESTHCSIWGSRMISRLHSWQELSFADVFNSISWWTGIAEQCVKDRSWLREVDDGYCSNTLVHLCERWRRFEIFAVTKFEDHQLNCTVYIMDIYLERRRSFFCWNFYPGVWIAVNKTSPLLLKPIHNVRRCSSVRPSSKLPSSSA